MTVKELENEIRAVDKFVRIMEAEQDAAMSNDLYLVLGDVFQSELGSARMKLMDLMEQLEDIWKIRPDAISKEFSDFFEEQSRIFTGPIPA